MKVASTVATLVFGLLLAATAIAQEYPTKQIRIIDCYVPGGITELLARTIGQKMSDHWGQQVIIEPRPGGGGNIGVEAAAKASPDGYTLLVVPSMFTTNPSLFVKLAWDPVRDFAPISLLARTPVVLVVNPSRVSATSVKELIAYAKANPGRLNYASGGVGATPHLAGELFKAMTGTDMVHIPYKGTAPAMTDLVGGQVDLSFSSPLTALPFIQDGRLKALATTGTQRHPALPNVPTIAEAGVPGYEVISWFGLLAPVRTPEPIVRKLNAEVVKILQMPDVKERASTIGLQIIASTPEQMAAFVKDDLAKWAKMWKEANIPRVQ